MSAVKTMLAFLVLACVVAVYFASGASARPYPGPTSYSVSQHPKTFRAAAPSVSYRGIHEQV